MIYVNPTSHDLELSGGRFRTVVDGSPTAIGQKIQARLLTVFGEWFLDTGFGLDYRRAIWNKATPTQVRNAHIQRQVLLSAGAGSSIRSYRADVDSAARTLTVTVDVQLAGGETVQTGFATGV